MAIRNPDRKVLVLWLVAFAMITVRELRDGTGMPRPAAYVPSSIIYGLSAILAEVAGDVSVMVAVGWTITLAIGLASQPRRDTEGGGGRSSAGSEAEGERGDKGKGIIGDRPPKPRPRPRPRRRRNPTRRRRRRLASARA